MDGFCCNFALELRPYWPVGSSCCALLGKEHLGPQVSLLLGHVLNSEEEASRLLAAFVEDLCHGVVARANRSGGFAYPGVRG